MADFDAIVVGAGFAGNVAALELARAGKSVLVIERGSFAGAKNMTGGRIYAHSLHKVFEGDFSGLPFERKISHERISLMGKDSLFTMDFSSSAMDVEGQESYTVLPAVFDQWLAEQAEAAGAEYICGIAVERLVKDDAGRVVGVLAGEDEVTADVVILADGCNSLLVGQAVGYERPKPSWMGVGVKQVIELPPAQIEAAFALEEGRGAAWEFAGQVTRGLFGGGVIYTNRESVSVGVVAGIGALAEKGTVPIYQMLEDFKANPAIAPILKGGRVVEHSGHMVPEGGLAMIPELVTDGCLICGDAAALCVNLGYTVRGMDYAVTSGQLAGQAAASALDAGDASARGLSRYVDSLRESYVLKDLETFKDAPAFLEGFDHMFNEYPEMVSRIFNKMFIVDGAPGEHLKKGVMPIVKEFGILNLLKDVRGALKAL